MTPTAHPNMTLFRGTGLSRNLLELIAYRDDLADELAPTVEAQTERQQAIEACDTAIKELVRTAAIEKADDIALVLREKRKRFEANRAEGQWLLDNARVEEASYEWLRAEVAEALASTIDQEVIETAHQNQVLYRVPGSARKMKLCSSGPSVAPPQMDLLPKDLQRVEITMTLAQWHTLLRVAGSSGVVDAKVRGPEPMLEKIAERLKEGPVPGARNKHGFHIQFK